MMDTRIYGIKNCDTMKKALKWLDTHNVAHEFIDYKKADVDVTILKQALSEHGWETVINKRGTTWRQLDKDIQDTMSNANAISVATAHASLIKRPLLVYGGKTFIGFSDANYGEIFGG